MNTLISDKLFDSMSILFKDTLSSSKIAKVVTATIVELLDSAIGQYSINYENQILKAYSNNTAVKYNKNDIVYILCQEGTLDGTLLIVGAQSPYAGLYSPDVQNERYIPVGDSLYIFNEEDTVELCTYSSDSTKNINYSTYGGNNLPAIFNFYLNNYKTFCFEFKVQTDIKDVSQRANGNYGIKMLLPFVQNGEQITKEFVFDINTMEGSPYVFTVPTTQKVYVQFEEGLQYDSYGNPTFQAFVKDFKRDTSITENDIFFSDISFYPVTVLDRSSLSGYYLKLEATEGNFFIGNSSFSDTKRITPTFLIDGVEMSFNNINYYWFVEDSSIVPNSEGYNRLGGTGWRFLNETEESQPFIDIDREDIITSKIYKCIGLYNGTSVEQKITIEDLSSNISIELINASGDIIEGGGDVLLDVNVIYNNGLKPEGETLYYFFQRYNYQDRFIDDNFYEEVIRNEKIEENGKLIYHTRIKFDSSIIFDGMNIIRCSVNGLQLIGTKSIVLTTNSNQNFNLIIENGSKVYKYDADGDSPSSMNFDGPDESRITDPAPLSYIITKKGIEFDESEYAICHTTWELPVNSLMKFAIPNNTPISADGKYYILQGTGKFNVSYTLENRYDTVKKENDTIYLTVNCDRRGTVLKQACTFSFLKDGETGTNGTKYSALITYKGKRYGQKDTNGIPQKFQLVWDGTSQKWYERNLPGTKIKTTPLSAIPLNDNNGFKVSVYSGGEEILNFLDAGVEVLDWSLFDNAGIQPYFEITENGFEAKRGNTGKWLTKTEAKSCILQVKIKVSDTDITDKYLTIYAYYPIEISYIDEVTSDIQIPMMYGGFDTVTYKGDGSNPDYYDREPFQCVDSFYNDDAGDVYDYVWSSSSNLVAKENSITSTCTFKPKSNYESGNSNNFIKATLTASSSATQDLVDEINIKQEECDELEENIIQKDNITNQLQYFSNEYNPTLWTNNISLNTILTYREQMITSCNDGLKNIDLFVETFGDKECSYNYTAVATSKRTRINTALTAIKLLISTRGLNNLVALNSTDYITFSATDEERIKALGIGIYEQVVQEANAFNRSVDDYIVYYNKINTLSSRTTDVDNLHFNYTQITNLTNSAYLEQLVVLDSDEFEGFQTSLIPFGAALTSGGSSDFPLNNKRDYSLFLNKLFALVEKYVTGFGNLNTAISKKYDSTEENLKFQKVNTEKVALQNELDSILALDNTTMVHIKPVLLLLNRYGLSYLNEWDGNRLYIDEEEGLYICSPTVGAGKKDNQNRFTGIVMGVENPRNGQDSSKVGLLGYSAGAQSIFLDAETGKAEFGVDQKGRIIIDPTNNTAEIKSGNYSETQHTGMLIDLSTPEIKFGSGNFSVDANGYAHIGGSGEAGGWIINDHEIKSPNSSLVLDSQANLTEGNRKGKIYSNTHSTLDSSQAGFYLANDGVSIGRGFVYNNANDILTIGSGPSNKKWTISGNNTDSYIGYNSSQLSDTTSNSVYIGTDGIRLDNKFKVTNSGVLELGSLSGKHWTVDSNVGESYIGYNSDKYAYPDPNQVEQDSPIYAPSISVYLGTDGIRLGNKFYVDNTGSLTTKKGKIADFVIQDDALFISVKNQSDVEINNKINPDETINTRNVFVGEDGIRLGYVEVIKNEQEEIIGRKFKFKVGNDGELICTKGTIAGWTVTDDEIYIKEGTEGNYTGINLNKNGTIKSYNNKWKLSKDGTAEFSKIRIDADGLNGTEALIRIGGTSGTLFLVNATGQLTCTGVDLSGAITAYTGAVGGFIIENGALYTNNKYTINTQGDGVHLSADGIAIGDTFKVTDDGNIDAESGTIGGITLDSNGLTVLNKFRIGKSGTIQCSAIDCTGGTIGCFTVSQGRVEIGQLATFTDNNVSIGGFTFSTNLMINSSGMAQVDIGKFASLYLGNDLVSTETISYDSGSGIRTITVLKI